MKNDKYEFLYNYSRSAFDDELARSKHIEDKASRFISLLSVLIVGYTALIKTSIDVILPAKGFFDWVVISAIALTYLALISSWSLLFRSLKFRGYPRLPLDDDLINRFDNKDLPTLHRDLSISCKDGLLVSRDANKVKSKLLRKSYGDMSFSVWLLSVSLFLLTTKYFLEDEIKMPNNDNKQTQQQPKQPQPDLNSTPPKIVMVLDSAIPKKK